MNHAFDNAQDDQDALEKHAPEADTETGELPWDGFRDGRIQNFLGLDWAGEKLADMDRAIAQNLAAFDAEHARRVEKLKALQAPLAKERLFWLNAIESYAGEQGRKALCVGRAKSRTLPSGLTLKWRESSGGYRWDQSKTPAENKAALLAWARSAQANVPTGEPMLTREWVTEEADLDAVKTFLQAHADPEQPRFTPPGLEYVGPGETLTVGVEEP